MKIICIGVNYRSHAIEMGRQFPAEPVVFLKPDSAVLKNNKPFFLPDFSANIHYETEVVVRISRLGKGIAPEFAYRYYDEVTAGIDITARDLQSRLSADRLPWTLSKAFDSSAPVGEFLPVSAVGDINNLDFRLEINNVTVQKGNTADMIFGIDKIISFVSGFFTLKTGDLIFTGTPSGVGALKKNDNLVAYIGDHRVLDFMIK